MNTKRDNLWLVGSGQMGAEYAKILNTLNIKYKVIGRGKKSASVFRKNTNKEVVTGGLKEILKKLSAPKNAIVAVNVEKLKETTELLLKHGTKRILLEKPGGINFSEIFSLYQLSLKKRSKVFIAYNRRFYSSVMKLKNLCQNKNKISNIFFDFSEWSHVVEKAQQKKTVKSKWLIANSSHVIDLAFYLAGKPKQLNVYKKGSLKWHKTASSFCGSGLTEKGIIFSYNSDWKSPGRWGLEIMTSNYRFILRPLESLKFIKKASIKIKDIRLKNKYDIKFKPGLYFQTKNFLEFQEENLCTLKQQVKNIEIYSKIGGYNL